LGKPFPVDTLVQLYIPTHKEGVSNKLSHNWFGPYQITKIVSPVNVELTHPTTHQKQIVHTSRIKPYHQDNSLPFPQDPVETENNFKDPTIFEDTVDKILDQRTKKGRKQYL